MSDCRLTKIFEMQRSLMHTFHAIEAANGFQIQSDIPVDLDLPSDQLRIREFAGRVTEEMAGEVVRAMRTSMEHLQEEIIDGLHFLTELSILVDFDTSRFELPGGTGDKDELDNLYARAFPNTYEAWLTGQTDPDGSHFRSLHPVSATHFKSLITDFLSDLWMACNCLKNKPWKQSAKKTDRFLFHDLLESSWVSFTKIMGAAGLGPQEAFEAYMSKHAVNEKRISDGV